MTGLIVLLILVPVVILLLLVSIYTRSGEQRQYLESLNRQLSDMARDIKALKEKQPPLHPVTQAPSAPAPITPPVQPVPQPEPPPAPVYKPAPAPIKVRPVALEPIPATPVYQEEEDERLIIQKTVPAEKKESWLSTNRDMEKFIGENLANKIGIAVLVLGISFFVKYAIDKNWINETGRVVIGLACGSILLGIAHYIRNNYRSFSSVLVGGGLTVFYFTIAFAFHQYQLIGQQAAFICMVVITAFAVGLSVFYDRKELAVLATIGGFVTPFLVSTGNANYIALFTYLSILCSGLMVLSWFKRWPVINIIALFFTVIIYGGWLLQQLLFTNTSSFPYKDALFFATLFYLLFIAMSIINNLRLKRTFMAFDFIIVLGTNFLYYAAGMAALSFWNDGHYQGLLTGLLGLFNLALAAIFYPKKKIDRNFIALLIGLSISFISLVAPVQLRGNHIALFWSTEAVVLYALYQRARITQLRIASFIVCLLMLVSVAITWSTIYFGADILQPIIANKGFITTLVGAIALFIYHRLLQKEDPAGKYLGSFSHKEASQYFLVTAIILAYIAGVLEIFYQFGTRVPGMPVFIIYWQLYSFAIAILLLWVFRRSAYAALLRFLLTALCFGLYLFQLVNNYQLSFNLLNSNQAGLFAGHWVAAALLGWLLYSLVIFFFRQKNDRWSVYRIPFTWVAASGIILLLSVEMYHIIVWTNYRDQADWYWWENLYYKAGLSILWGICSFVMMWLGMKYSFRTLRIISLSLFTITIAKLFLYDIRKIPPGGKIAAFILLGVLLLTVSFMYQRLKKIIIDKEV